jgi:hypothetical protein
MRSWSQNGVYKRVGGQHLLLNFQVERHGRDGRTDGIGALSHLLCSEHHLLVFLSILAAYKGTWLPQAGCTVKTTVIY